MGSDLTTLTRAGIWSPETAAAVERLAAEGLAHGAEALTRLVDAPVQISAVRARRVTLADLPSVAPDPEAEAVGIFLLAEGDLRGQFLFLLTPAEAGRLADVMLGRAPGSTAALDPLARSALGEMGNILSALFLTTLAESTRRSGRPSPPAVVVDMAGALVNLLLTAGGRLEDYLIVIDATFTRAGQAAEAHFWVRPEQATLRAVARSGEAV